MCDDIPKFPRTPHLAWLGTGEPRGDKVLSVEERKAFLAGKVAMEEKIDGANLGLSMGPDGRIRMQNRGGYIGPGAHPQFAPLWSWLAEREMVLAGALGSNLVLFGEWCFALHSIRYDQLPDWFLAFDVFDKSEGRFWSAKRRGELLAQLDLSAVPRLGHGHYSFGDLVDLLNHPSSMGSGPLEGLYVRRESGGWLEKRAKLVRAEFVQTIDEHWSKRPLEKNQLDQRDSVPERAPSDTWHATGGRR